MLDTAYIGHQRSRGVAHVGLARSGHVTSLFQQGSAKAMLPRGHGPAPEVVFLNTSGGLTGGDRLSLSLNLAAGSQAIAATQTAERAYASSGGVAEVDVTLDVGEGATCLWLPQETILFNNAALARRTEVTLGMGSRYLGLETLVLGRAAMGEDVTAVEVSETRRIRAASGQLIHIEQIGLNPDILARRSAPAGLHDQTVLASLVYVAVDAADRLLAVRDLIDGVPGMAASAWDGRLVLRASGNDTWDMRRALAPVILTLGLGALPRVWQM